MDYYINGNKARQLALESEIQGQTVAKNQQVATL